MWGTRLVFSRPSGLLLVLPCFARTAAGPVSVASASAPACPSVQAVQRLPEDAHRARYAFYHQT